MMLFTTTFVVVPFALLSGLAVAAGSAAAASVDLNNPVPVLPDLTTCSVGCSAVLFSRCHGLADIVAFSSNHVLAKESLCRDVRRPTRLVSARACRMLMPSGRVFSQTALLSMRLVSSDAANVQSLTY